MLDFIRHPVRILHLNVRTEVHGDEERTAVDIKLGFDLPNRALDKLSPSLRASLYEVLDDPNLPVLGPDGQHLTHVKNPQLGTLKWAGEYAPVGLHFHTGNGRSAKGDLLFPEATFGKLAITAKEGGTCACVARAQILPNPDETAKLVGLLKHEIPATLDSAGAVDTEVEGADDE
ncbi:hypothetical protein PPMP20_26590 [Paraburkholderia phymatum]|uniref:Uncharacterized protein n=1 Tax=Paraburkholderia phymatum (strain DSM 17167 / CIP 108236 / LMG 21445 / STM815) TaxID=391038 RepID=B2JL43_PARP8|nr:hypothetical protein [Paraburkholderia phymatum]ACC72572.1 hypothetical protein Bphy_3418 [Paraburkholderia phymatum STM815]